MSSLHASPRLSLLPQKTGGRHGARWVDLGMKEKHSRGRASGLRS